MAERLVRNEKVRGSTPLGSTSLIINNLRCKMALVATLSGNKSTKNQAIPRLSISVNNCELLPGAAAIGFALSSRASRAFRRLSWSSPARKSPCLPLLAHAGGMNWRASNCRQAGQDRATLPASPLSRRRVLVRFKASPCPRTRPGGELCVTGAACSGVGRGVRSPQRLQFGP